MGGERGIYREVWGDGKLCHGLRGDVEYRKCLSWENLQMPESISNQLFFSGRPWDPGACG